ncbi:MAG: hypothetical protein ABF703_08230 [Oenococcus sp.]|uniref:Uncharacterized protein n=1 Tax=Oenococcus kitaharae DSM 17330 TaxID=1045004 RepID=G9WI06_9LACO|nr:hypothetical protein [Oenococcus kitaharae]EHN58891.1 hypothetical protein OKIT_0782 [Oenococcus kitaharae DSM 17330]MCV3296331.1 hypothetical protein [Oenococcus kitaharae]OEY81786.1 hypothetical protein NT96_08440 [Oenococcus kitaharae]OEY84017.1 hypothetical protein NT95_02500 [Oenococcus kitaharae]OEY85627.1 hypothetical protein NV75_03935 [Oenococcus kitaharae]
MIRQDKQILQLQINNKETEIQVTGPLAKKLSCLTKVKAGNIGKINDSPSANISLDHQLRRVLTEAGIPLLQAYRVIRLLSADVLLQILRAYDISGKPDGLVLTRKY